MGLDFLSTINKLQELEFADASVIALLFNYKVDSEIQEIKGGKLLTEYCLKPFKI